MRSGLSRWLGRDKAPDAEPPGVHGRLSRLRFTPDAESIDVVFSTGLPYQVDELVGVAAALGKRGLQTAFLDHPMSGVGEAGARARGFGLRLIPFPEYLEGAVRPRVLVVRSDVSGRSLRLVDHANAAGIATAALAHPVINFTRHPEIYRNPGSVLCTGPFTAARLPPARTRITGFPFLDDLLAEPAVFAADGPVVPICRYRAAPGRSKAWMRMPWRSCG